jgi:predicted amidophosphoribosyltransferase
MAEPVARAIGLPAADLLARPRARDQRALGRAARLSSARGSFSANREVPAKVIVVDDVMTTGATLDAAAQVLLAAGASSVRVAAVARAW